MDGLPGTQDKWPTPIAVWSSTVMKTLTVVGKDQLVVARATDEAENPFKTVSIAVAEAAVVPTTHGRTVAIKWKVDGRFTLPVCYRLTLRTAVAEYPYGSWFFDNNTSGRNVGIELPSRRIPRGQRTFLMSKEYGASLLK
jgi:hypothetical protein